MTSTRRSPYFPFYPDDFVGGVQAMTAEQVGAYILLLCHQWSSGSIPSSEKLIRLIAKVGPRADLESVIAKFPEVNGVRQNARLEEVRQKVEARSHRCANNGKKGGRPKQNETNEASQTEPTEKLWVSDGLPVGSPSGNPNQSIPKPKPNNKATATTHTLGEGDPAAAATETASPDHPDHPAPADAGPGKDGAPAAPDPADDPEVAALLGEGVVVPTDEEVHAWAKAWPGFPALGIPAGIDAAWLDRQLAWYAHRRKPFPRDWKRDIELEYRQAWRMGKVKPSPGNGGPPVPAPAPEADTSTLPKSFAKLDPESQRLVLRIRAGCPQRWQRREDIAWWSNKAAEYDGGSLDGSPEHQRALRIVAALEAP